MLVRFIHYGMIIMEKIMLIESLYHKKLVNRLNLQISREITHTITLTNLVVKITLALSGEIIKALMQTKVFNKNHHNKNYLNLKKP